mmetsp:Transcript_4404/g.13342  ORF Transcript_4404/g.13342 Transcript_4404/m.13342 type:complete len:249 (-) Transcript_4404:221-967(-)
MDWDRGETQIPEQQRVPPGAVAGSGEYHSRRPRELCERVHQVALLKLGGNEEVLLPEGVHGAVLGTNLHPDWVLEAGPLKLLNLARHGRREELGAPVPRDDLENLVDLLLEVHVEEPVSLVKHEVLQLVQVEALGVRQVVDDPTGRAHNDVRPAPQGDALCHHVHPADEDDRLQPYRHPEGLELLRDLDGELSGGRQHKRKEGLRLVQQLLQDRKGKGAGLTASGLGKADDVLAVDELRHSLSLNVRR